MALSNSDCPHSLTSIIPLSPWRLCRNWKERGRGSRVPCPPAGRQSFRMRIFQIMGSRRFYKIERNRTPGTAESEWLKATALNLFHPTASPPFPKESILHIGTQSPCGRGRGWRGIWFDKRNRFHYLRAECLRIFPFLLPSPLSVKERFFFF